MAINDFKSLLISELSRLHAYKASANMIQHTVRCPYCGDSKKSFNHGHFSIKIDINTPDAIVYRCLKCNESGLFTSTQLEDLNLHSQDLIKEINNFNITARKGKPSHMKDKGYKIPMPLASVSNFKKLRYLNDRLGTDLEYKDCIDNNIILDFNQFLQHNGIPYDSDDFGYKLTPNIYSNLNNFYIGFLSSNRNKITFRDITNECKMGRYYKVTLDRYHESVNNFYATKNTFELLYTSEMNVHIAEGTFDIISIKENVMKGCDPLTNLFFASCGFSFNTIIKYLIGVGVNTDLHLHIYADNDKSDDEIIYSTMNMINNIWVDKLTIHRNKYGDEKDFGVPMSRIDNFRYRHKI